MAGNGPPPSPTKRRRNADPIEGRTVEVDPARTDDGRPGLDLPVRDDGWHPATVELWEEMRRSPLMRDEPRLTWLYLLDTMLMHDTMWAKGRWEYASELRLRLAQFGITPADRARLRIKIATPDAEDSKSADATPQEVKSRRRSLHIAG